MKNTFTILLLTTVIGCSKPSSTQHEIPAENAVVQPADNSVTSVDTVTIPTQETDTIGVSGQRVYITHEGDKYHTADCRYSKEANAVSLQQAKASGKTACGICKPNSKTGDKQMRCSAKTKEGKQCQRMTSSASGKCYQHQSN
jgi:hypothetical protein